MEPLGSPDWERLYEHEAFVRGLARRILGDDPSVDDVVQDTYVAAWQRRCRTSQNVRGWLASVARNGALMVLRARRRRKRHEQKRSQPAAPRAADQLLAEDELRRSLSKAVVRLPERYRRAVQLRFYDALSFSQIGQRLGVSKEAARQRVDKAVQMLILSTGIRTDDPRWTHPLAGLAGLHSGVEETAWMPTQGALGSRVLVASLVCSTIGATGTWLATGGAAGPNRGRATAVLSKPRSVTAGPIRGTVLGTGGSPVGSIRLRLVTIDSEWSSRHRGSSVGTSGLGQVETRQDGTFRFHRVAAGRYVLVASGLPPGVVFRPTRVDPGWTGVCQLEVARRVSGEVNVDGLDPAASASDRAKWRVEALVHGIRCEATALVGRTYVLESLPPGPVLLRLVARGHAAEPVVVVRDEQPRAFHVRRP